MRSAPDSLAHLERLMGRLLVTGVTVSAVLLAAGLALWLAHPSPASLWLLNAGLVVLMATPILRVLVSFAEYLRLRDWLFVGATVVVLVELALTVALANR
ncbi:MAG: DUF1634 domain-containing protein [Acidobacteriota bacterium]